MSPTPAEPATSLLLHLSQHMNLLFVHFMFTQSMGYTFGWDNRKGGSDSPDKIDVSVAIGLGYI